MKKLYFLNETEKERILKLHKSHQVGKFWLNEQEELPTAKTVGDPDTYSVTTAFPNGTWSQEAKDEFMGYIDSYTTSEYAGYAVRPTVAKIKNFCETQVDQMGGPSIATNKILLNAKNHESFMKANSRSSWYTLGTTTRGITDAPGLVPLIKQLENIPNLCYSIRTHKTLRGQETVADIYDEVYYDSTFQQVVLGTLRILALQTKVAKPLKSNVKAGGETGGVEGDEDFLTKFSCLDGIATATKGKGVYRVDNPSSHINIIDKSQGKPTNISEKTLFLSDGTYQTDTDAMRETFSGRWKCDASQEKVLLFPGNMGVGSEGNIYSKHPCLATESPSGDLYTSLDPSDNNKAIMDDELRQEHPIFKTYPEGEIYFNVDGTFLTEKDFDNDVEKSGRFKCKGKGLKKISAKPYGTTSTTSTTPTPIPAPIKTTTGGGGGAPVSGMGIVLGSVQGEIAEVLKCAKVGGTTLTQDALNKLYDFIKNNK